MIVVKSYTIKWITDLRNKLGKRIDPKLIEKVIYALTFLEQLQLNKEENQKIERFRNPLEIKDWLIEDPAYNKLNKLKKTNPETFFYWYKTIKEMINL